MADLTNHSLKSRAAAVSIASNATLIAFKLTVGILSGSIAIISEALHSGSDLVAALIAFWSVRQRRRAAGRAPPVRPREGREPERRHRGAAHHRRRRCHHLRGRHEDHRRPLARPHLARHRRDGHLGHHEPHRLAQGALPGRAAHAVGGAGGRRRPPAHRRLHLVRRGLRPAARQDHRLAVLRPHRRHRRRRAHHPHGLRAGHAVHARAARRDAAGRRSSRRSAAACASIAATSSAATTSCARGAPAAAGTSTCTWWSTTDLTVTEAHDIAEHIEADIRACVPNTDVLVHVEPRTQQR